MTGRQRADGDRKEGTERGKENGRDARGRHNGEAAEVQREEEKENGKDGG